MFLFYADETGNRDLQKADDWLYVLTAVSLFEHKWHGFDKTINRRKSELIRRIRSDAGVKLELADCEVKSNWVRIPKERAAHPFLGNLTEKELTDLIDLYYRQLEHNHMHILAVLVDKRQLHDFMDQEKLHRKSWECLLEQVERLMRMRFDKHQAILVNDDVSRQANRSLAMKHTYLQDQGTAAGTWLRHICEMPMFVRSELSNGVQLADLCSYNIYRAFRDNNLDYPFFNRIRPHIWSRSNPVERPFSGLFVFPPSSPLRDMADKLETE